MRDSSTWPQYSVHKQVVTYQEPLENHLPIASKYDNPFTAKLGNGKADREQGVFKYQMHWEANEPVTRSSRTAFIAQVVHFKHLPILV